MSEQQTPKSPKEQLATAISEIDSLESMKDKPGYDEETSTDLRAGPVNQIIEAFEADPSLQKEVNPMIAHALAIRAEELALRDARREEQFPNESQPTVDESYKDGALYARLSAESQKIVDGIMLDLLEPEALEEKSTVVTSAQEAADSLGLNIGDVERAYGLLSSIEDDRIDGDDVEFLAINFDQKGGDPIPRGNGNGDESTDSGSNKLSNKYVARIRRMGGDIESLVLDAVPPARDNAVYILRNDDRTITTVSSSFPSKVEARANGARRVFHNDKTGEAGVVKRIHKLLLIPFDQFKRADEQ